MLLLLDVEISFRILMFHWSAFAYRRDPFGPLKKDKEKLKQFLTEEHELVLEMMTEDDTLNSLYFKKK